MLDSNCNCSTEVHNDMVFITIKATVGGENYNCNYCIRKTVIITQLITMAIQLLQHLS